MSGVTRVPAYLLVYSDVAHELRDILRPLTWHQSSVRVDRATLERALDHIKQLEDERNARHY